MKHNMMKTFMTYDRTNLKKYKSKLSHIKGGISVFSVLHLPHSFIKYVVYIYTILMYPTTLELITITLSIIH